MNYKKDLAAAGISYLGSVSQSMKLRLSEEHGTMTYGVYLAPANMSGYEVCPVSKFCRQFCLSGSGHNKVQLLSGKNSIQNARIKKTRLFFEDRELFMRLLVHEITRYKKYARRKRMRFAVRLNCTSDISPEDFVLNGKNILQLFPRTQFYDYTKVPSRLSLSSRYKNYDLTFSYNGYNGRTCETFLNQGGKVAVVFGNLKSLPIFFMGFPVHDGNEYDMRFLDPSGVIGLHYHPVANDYKKGKFVMPDTPFVIKNNDPRCVWS